MSCFIKIDSAWVETNNSSSWFKIFSQFNTPIAHLSISGDIDYGYKGVDSGVTLPMVHISTNNIRLYIEERVATLAHTVGYWGYAQILIRSYARRDDAGSKTILCMFYVPGDKTDDLSSITYIPEKVNILRYYPSMNEERMRKNLVIADIMAT